MEVLEPEWVKAGVTAKVMVGSAPVTQTLAEKIDAHGYAASAQSALNG